MGPGPAESRTPPRGPVPTPRAPIYVPERLAQTGEYSIFGLTRHHERQSARERRRSFTLIVFGVATVVAALFAIERYFYRLLFGQPISLVQLVPAELVFTYIWALLTPLIMWSARRFPLRGLHRTRNVLVQLVAVHLFVLLHVVLFSTASLLFGGESQRAIPFGRLFSGYLLSWFVVDVIVFCSIVAVHHAVIYYRVSQD